MSAGKNKMDQKTVVIAGAVGIAGILVAAQLMAKPSGPAAATSRSKAASAPASPRVIVASKNEALKTQVEVKSAAVPVRNFFNPLVVVAPPPPPVTLKADLPKEKPQVVKPIPIVAPPAPAFTPPAGASASDLQMMGVIEMGENVQALVKQTSTGESRYVASGDSAFGFTVKNIRAKEMELSKGGGTETIRMATNVVIEGPGASSSAGQAAFGGGGGGFGGGFGGGGFGGGRRRGGRGGGGFGGDGGGFGGGGGGFGGGGGSEAGAGGDTSGFSVSTILSAPLNERLKKLEEWKGKLEPSRYESLHKTISAMVARAKGGGK